MNSDKIYTRSESADIIGIIEDVLIDCGIRVPSPEDDERDPDDDVGFYGSTYSNLLDEVEAKLCALLERVSPETTVVTDVFE